MSATVAERNAVVKELLRISQMFKQNVALKHGLPMPTETGLEQLPQPAGVATAAPMVQPSSGVHPAQASAWPAWVKPALAAGAIALGSSGATAWLVNRDDPQPPANVTIQEAAPASGSLLQWLEDNGQHLPPE